LQSAQEQGLINYQVTDWGFGLFVDSINDVGGGENMFWSLYINNSVSMQGATDLKLNEGDEMLMSYVNWNYSNEVLAVSSSATSTQIGNQVELKTEQWTGSDFSDFNSTSTFFINDLPYIAATGTLEYTPTIEGNYKIYVEAEGKTRSDIQTIIVLPAQQTTTSTEPVAQTNRAIVNYLNEEIFNNDVSATSTWFYDSSGALYSTSTVSALGVLAEASRQGNFPLTIQGGWGYYVSDIGNHAAQGFDGWIYNINQQNPGWVGMNDYQIQNNDLLTVFYSVWPWKIESSTSSVYLDENVIFTAFNYASSTWQTSASTTISIDSQIFVTDDNGQYLYTPSATGTLSAFIYGSESWPQNSPTINVAVTESMSTSTPPTDNPPPADTGGGGGGSSTPTPAVSSAVIAEKAQTILNFLKNQQEANGGIKIGYDKDNKPIIDGGVTDWAIMSLASHNEYADDIKNNTSTLLNFAKGYNITTSTELNVCAGYPRHVLALLAGGVSGGDSLIQSLIAKIKGNECYQNNLYGQNGINDDVFALLSLLAVDIAPTEPIIIDIVSSTLKDQIVDGSFTWGGFVSPEFTRADITGAAINALQYAKNKGATIDQNIFTKALAYLKSQQLSDGGWGFGASDSLTTSWAMMGINSLGEGQTDWTNSQNKN
ncbi:MAG: DUF4430 domain-containing protein, partial [Bacteroidota bacterium]